MKSSGKFFVFCRFLLVAALLLSFTACNQQTVPQESGSQGRLSKQVTIGILQFEKNAQYDVCRTGFLTGLTNAGLSEGSDFKIEYKNADGDERKAERYAKELAAGNADILFAIGAPAADACFAATEGTEKKVIYTAVSESEAEAVEAVNATGIAIDYSVKKQLELIHSLQSKAKTLGVLFDVSDPDAASLLERYYDLATEYKLEIVAKGTRSADGLEKALDALLDENVDCLALISDTLIDEALPKILEKTNEAEIPVYGSSESQVKRGCAAAAAIDYEEVGREAGDRVAGLLFGYITCATLPFDVASDSLFYLNRKALASVGISVSEKLMETAVLIGE